MSLDDKIELVVLRDVVETPLLDRRRRSIETDRRRRSSFVNILAGTSHYQRQTRIMILGGTLLAMGWAVDGTYFFVSTIEALRTRKDNGYARMVAAILQTTGAMIVAVCDMDIDLFAKRHPICVGVFAFAWIVLYDGIQTLTPPVAARNQIYWLPTLPFVYLVVYFRAVLQMRTDDSMPRFSDLFAYCLSFDFIANGLVLILDTHAKHTILTSRETWPHDLVGVSYCIGGIFLFGNYWSLRSKYSRRLALSMTLFAYLLLYGFNNGVYHLMRQFVYDEPTLLIQYAFSIIHITLPAAYFAFRPIIYLCLGRLWLKQRITNRDSVMEEQGIASHNGNLSAIQEALNLGVDLNAYIENNSDAADEFTLLILACFNGHEDAIDLLLRQDGVQVNKGSRHQNWTPLYVAAMRGFPPIVEKLIGHHANVHAKTEDDLNALLVATAHGHTQITQQLMEMGARKASGWMGMSAEDAATALRQDSTLRALFAYESHFEGNIREVKGCTCVASWPGIYARSW
jgi:hypothetical protein